MQIVPNQASRSKSNSEKSPTRLNASTPAVSGNQSYRPVILASKPSTVQAASSVESAGIQTDQHADHHQPVLKVANNTQTSSDMDSFYVTPFDPDQSEDDVMRHVVDISNVHSSLVKVTKLVPRGKNLQDLSFVSFKVTVCKSVSNIVGDSWYWPQGIAVRLFEPNQKNGTAVRLPSQL